MCRKMIYLISFVLLLSLVLTGPANAGLDDDPNLVGWWKLNTDTNDVAVDSSGNNRDGIINGGPVLETGSPYDDSGCLDFDGTDDWVDVNHLSFLLPNYTVAMYFRLDGGVSDERVMFSAVNVDEGHGIYLSINRDNPGTIRYIHRYPIGPGGVGFEDTFSPADGTLYNDGQWHHVAAVRESDPNRFLYVDGGLVATNTNALGAFDESLRILFGTVRPGWLARFWNGGMDDVRIYNRALSSAEIEELASGVSIQARSPNPEHNATDVPNELTLIWTPGIKAASHKVYFDPDEQKVTARSGCDVNGVSTTESNYPLPELELDQTYYWAIDEVNGASVWPGSVWSFTTANYLVVDDMDEYGDDIESRIYYVWRDGWDVNDSIQGNDTGSQVYHWNDLGTDFMESEIVRSGVSMPYYYENDGDNQSKPYPFDNLDNPLQLYSEASASTSDLPIGTDWTIYDFKALSLWFYGDPNNDAEPMYVALEGGDNHLAVVEYDGDVNDIKEEQWHQWDIPLSEFGGVNTADVQKIYIGFGDRDNPQSGGAGIVYFDDIRLYPSRCILSGRSADLVRADFLPVAMPVSGDCVVNNQELEIMASDWLMMEDTIIYTDSNNITNGLVAYYPLDEGTGTTTADASVNDNNGTFSESGITWVTPGLLGNSAINADGAPGGRISIGTFDPVGPEGEFTLSLWARCVGIGNVAQGLIGKRDGWGDNDVIRFTFAIWSNNQLNLTSYVDGAYSAGGVITPYISRWAHLAATFDDPNVTFYVNGQDVGSGTLTLGTATDATMTIGNTMSETAWPQSPETFNGDIDEVRIYNRALTQAEIAYLADLTPGDGKFHVPVVSVAEIYGLEAEPARAIDLRDFAVLAKTWLEEQLWP